jgi:anhydro-N-acetylmuramic acid kinase
MSGLYIGLMSGTSLDGVDAVLADFSTPSARVLGYVALPLPGALRAELLALNHSGPDELHRAALAANALVRVYAQAVGDLLVQTGFTAPQVRAIGAHGQTVRHQPGLHDPTGYTLQLNQPALLAELTGITVVADFRSRDVAAGGQGAPLVPAFHRAFFGSLGEGVSVLNLGGIANLTTWQGDTVRGWDVGPGNALLDGWCQLHTGAPYDDQGRWASGGQVVEGLLQTLLAEPYFALPPPKSTGRDLFHMPWLQSRLQALSPSPRAQDVQATLTELTARSCAQELARQAAPTRRLLVCGGGAFNAELLRRLRTHLPGVDVRSTESEHLPPLQVEATAFAWLAWQTLEGRTSSLASVTGARGARILGAIYPA